MHPWTKNKILQPGESMSAKESLFYFLWPWLLPLERQCKYSLQPTERSSTHTTTHAACDSAASAGGVHVGGVGAESSSRMASTSSQDGLQIMLPLLLWVRPASIHRKEQEEERSELWVVHSADGAHSTSPCPSSLCLSGHKYPVSILR